MLSNYITEQTMQLQIDNISKSFGDKKVLDGISLTAASGRAFGLLGRNGAGKTTTIRILLGVFEADGGQILVDGTPIDRAKIKFGYLPEERGLYPKKPIIDQLVYFAMLKGMSRSDATAAADKWLDRLGMSEYRNKRLDTLSKGNQQKIQLVTALAHNPDIVVLDEPFSGLDPVNVMLLKDVVREVIDQGKIVLFSGHQMNYIEEFCDDIALLHHGKVVLGGNLEEIKQSYPQNKLVLRSPETAKILAELPDVTAGEHDTLLYTPHIDVRAAMQQLTAKYKIDEVSIFRPSLNDIFVEYTDDQYAEKEEQA